jgi:hypothetical protein
LREFVNQTIGNKTHIDLKYTQTSTLDTLRAYAQKQRGGAVRTPSTPNQVQQSIQQAQQPTPQPSAQTPPHLPNAIIPEGEISTIE